MCAFETIGAADSAVTGTLLTQRVGTPDGAIALMNTAQTIFTHLLAIIAAPGAEAILPPGLLRATVVYPAKRVLAQRPLVAIVTAIASLP